jgi:hypothetical protein
MRSALDAGFAEAEYEPLAEKAPLWARAPGGIEEPAGGTE